MKIIQFKKGVIVIVTVITLVILLSPINIAYNKNIDNNKINYNSNFNISYFYSIKEDDSFKNDKIDGETVIFNKRVDGLLPNETYYFKFKTTLDDKPQDYFTLKCKGIDEKFYNIVTKPYFENQNVTVELYYDTIWDFRKIYNQFMNSPIEYGFKQVEEVPRVLIQIEPPHLRYCSNNIDCISKLNWSVSYESIADFKVGFHLENVDNPFIFNARTKLDNKSIMERKYKFIKEYEELKLNNTLKEHQLIGVPLASWFCSNCENTFSNRESYVDELMKYIVIDSFGKCLNNIPTTGLLKRSSEDPFNAKLRMISNYKFNIVFENANCLDYITEKALNALQAGTVPIYMGHPQTLKYLPLGSYIYVGDFKTAKDLVI